MLELFENKTSAAFRVSLLLGAAVGGASSETLEILDGFSHFIGIAYQVKDDLADYHGDKGDIMLRKFSIILSLLAEKLSPEERQILLAAYESDNYQVISELIDLYDIQNVTKALLVKTIQEAKDSLDKLSNLGLKLALYEILGKIFKEYI